MAKGAIVVKNGTAHSGSFKALQVFDKAFIERIDFGAFDTNTGDATLFESSGSVNLAITGSHKIEGPIAHFKLKADSGSVIAYLND